MARPDDFQRISRAFGAWARSRGHGMGGGGGGDGQFSSLQFKYADEQSETKQWIALDADLDANGKPVILVRLSGDQRDENREAAQDVPIEAPCTRYAAAEQREVMIAEGRAELAALVQPTTVCEGCGAMGTISKIARTSASGVDLEVHRFCRDCFPEQEARFAAREKLRLRKARERHRRGDSTHAHSDGSHWSYAANSWHILHQVAEETLQATRTSPPPSPQDLKAVAQWMRDAEPIIDEPMPEMIKWFISAYGAPTA